MNKEINSLALCEHLHAPPLCRTYDIPQGYSDGWSLLMYFATSSAEGVRHRQLYTTKLSLVTKT